MKALSAFLVTLMFILTGCGGSGVDDHADTSKYLRVSMASATIDSPVSVNKYVTLVFSSNIDETTVDASSVYIADENNISIAADLTVSKEKISIIPNEFFLPSNQYTIVVTTDVEDMEGRTLENIFTYAFVTASTPDTLPPSLLTVTPEDNTQAPVTTDIIMEFDENIAGNGVLQLKESDTNIIVNGTTMTSEYTLHFVPEGNLTYGSNYTVSLQGTVEDLAGNAYGGLTSWNFSVTPEEDLMPPSLISVTPADGTKAAKTTDIVMEFDESISGNGVLQLKESDTNITVNGTTTISNNTLRFIPDSDLMPDANYTVTLLGSVNDLAGNAYSGLTSWDFSVNPLVDITPPSLISVTPADGTEAAKTTDIVMEFDESITGDGAIQLKDSDTNIIVNGTTTISGSTLYFIPQSDLVQDSNYTVTLQGTVEDLAGNDYGGLRSWNFSIIPVSDLRVVSASHSGKVIRIEFSEDLNASTVSESDFAINGGSITFDHLIIQNNHTVKFVADSNLSGTEDISVSGTIKDIYGNSHNNGVTAIYNLGG